MFENVRKSVSLRKSAKKKSARQAILRLEPLEDRCLLSISIVTNPISRTAVLGQTTAFTAAATGSPTPTVQWEMSTPISPAFTPVPASAPFGGATTDALTISGATAALNGAEFEAVFSSSGNPSVATTPAALTVVPGPTIGALTHTDWTKGFAGFNGTLTISGGIGAYSLVSDSGLPTGLTAVLSGSTISFTGTTTLAQVFSSGTITIQDAAGDKATRNFSITIHNAPTISHMSNNNWTEGATNFNGVMTISDGTGPYSLVGDSGLPPGITPVINGDSIGFTGTPSVAKTFNPTITIKDAAGATASRTIVIAVDPAIILGNLTQTQWTVSEPGFSGTLTIGGGTGPFTLAGSSGLPKGLSAKVGGGAVSFTGTPTVVGTFPNGSVTVTDADGASVTQTFSITINPAPTLSPLTTTQWTQGESGFTDNFIITGGTGPYTITGYGNLPFTPSVGGNTVYLADAAANRSLTDGFVTIRDSAGASTTQTVPIFTINPQPTVSALTWNQWTAGQPGFNGNMTITYGTAPFTVATFNNLPNGLTPVVNGVTIGFNGTPTVARSFGSGSITLVDSGGATFTVPVSITINPPLTITTTSVPAVTAGAHYSTTLKTSGGSGANSFKLTGGNLPAGLTLDSNGKIAGASSATGAFPFTATVTDAVGAQFSQNFTIAVAPAFAIGNLTQTQWTVNQAGFSAAMNISGGAGTFAITSATGLPKGLKATLTGHTINITGTPTVAGTFASGSITVADSLAVSYTATFTITINAGPTVGALSATAWTAQVGGFSGTITINGGTGPYTIVNSHGLPFSPVISGNTILFTGAASGGVYAKGTLTVRDQTGATVTANIGAITINPPLAITHMSNNNWTEGTPNFNGALTITGGTGPFTIIDYRNLPLGLLPVIKGNLVTFPGTPTAAGTFSNCYISIEDASGEVHTRTFVIAIAPPLRITTTHLAAWSSGVNYSTTLQATGGTGPRTFTLTSGKLPPGLTLQSNGKIHGVATALGSFTFTVTVTDAMGDAFSETFTL